MEEAIIALMLADAALAALIADGVHALVRPQGSPLPAVVVTVVSDLPDYTMAGRSDLSQARIQIDAYGSTYAEMKAVARAADNCLSGYRGTIGATKILGVFKDGGGSDGRETDGVDEKFRSRSDYAVASRPA